MRVRWLRAALGNLDRIGAFIARYDPAAASRVIETCARLKGVAFT